MTSVKGIAVGIAVSTTSTAPGSVPVAVLMPRACDVDLDLDTCHLRTGIGSTLATSTGAITVVIVSASGCTTGRRMLIALHLVNPQFTRLS